MALTISCTTLCLKMFLYYCIVFLNIPTPPVKALLKCSPNQINSIVGFWWKRKTRVARKLLLGPERRTSRFNSLWHQVYDLNPVHIGVRRVLAPPCQPWSPRFQFCCPILKEQCCLGLIQGLLVKCVLSSLVLYSVLKLRLFFSGMLWFSPLTKTKVSWFDLTWIVVS